MIVKFKRWKVFTSLLFFLIVLEMNFCFGRRTRQVENMLEDFDIESSLPRFSQPIPNITVTIGKDALLPCVVDRLSSYKVAWVRVDTQTILTIHQQVITRNQRITLSYSDHRSWFLQIKNTHESDRGWYMCQINTDPMRSLMGYLEVVVPPEIIDQDTSIDLVAKEGSNVTLHCKAKGHPEPYVMWRREDNQEIQYNGNLVNVIDGEVFPIIKISRLHMGAYLCIASNGIPPSISKRVEVKVQFPPMLSIPHQLEGAYIGQDVTIECHTEAHPKSINYWTTEKGDMIVSGEKYESFLVDSSYRMYMRLKIRNLTRSDFGVFKCVAKNSLGETDGNIKLYEIAAPPTTPSTTVKPTPLPSKKPKKKSKVNEVVIDSGYDEWSNNKGQPNFESQPSMNSASSSHSRLFLVGWMEFTFHTFWTLLHERREPTFAEFSKDPDFSLSSSSAPYSYSSSSSFPSRQHISSTIETETTTKTNPNSNTNTNSHNSHSYRGKWSISPSHSHSFKLYQRVEKSPNMSTNILYTLCLTLILIHFH